MTEYQNFIFMDNFRGFSNSILPLTKTNFFVGENSSGKSSVLALIKILTDFMFWNKADFKSDEVNLGHFSDIVSVSAKNKSYFRVGYLPKNVTKGNETLFKFGYLITFLDKRGIPEPSVVSFIYEKTTLHIRVHKDSFSYRVDEKEDVEIKSVEDAKSVFAKLVDVHTQGKGFTRTKTATVSSAGLMYAHHIVVNEIQTNKEKSFSEKVKSLYGIYPSSSPIWIAPIRSKPKRTYDEPTYEFSSEGEHTPYVLQSILYNTKSVDLKKYLEHIGESTGLFKEVALKKYGRNKNAPFELDIVLDANPLSILNVGYGVSQSLPILAELLVRPAESWFIIQQPEVHLHPKAQAAIGDLIFDTSFTWKNSYLIETHSDYMIDRYRIRMAKHKKLHKSSELPSSQILFFCRKDGLNTVHPIEIKPNGEIDSSQPPEYRDFFLNEQFQILGL